MPDRSSTPPYPDIPPATAADVPYIRVFAADTGSDGGNPAPVWLNADSLSGPEMQARARASGHESVFVQQADDGQHRWRMRYFVPNHEMEMCGHATIGALWLLHASGQWTGDPVRIQTLSGTVHGRLNPDGVEISQPCARIETVDPACTQAIAHCLGIPVDRIVGPVLNASTSRVKTLIRVDTAPALHGLSATQPQVEALCEQLGSTGLYPFTVLETDPPRSAARQFPKSSGYLEDPATGIAAAALAWGLRHLGLTPDQETVVTVHQGDAMGSPSRIRVRLPQASRQADGCWLGGQAQWMKPTTAFGGSDPRAHES